MNNTYFHLVLSLLNFALALASHSGGSYAVAMFNTFGAGFCFATAIFVQTRNNRQ